MIKSYTGRFKVVIFSLLVFSACSAQSDHLSTRGAFSFATTRIFLSNNLTFRAWYPAESMEIDAKPLVAFKPYPLIIFDPGYMSFIWQSSSKIEELASNGYIVFSVYHSGESLISPHPDEGWQFIDLKKYRPINSMNIHEARRRRENTSQIYNRLKQGKNVAARLNAVDAFSDIDYLIPVRRAIDERVVRIVDFLDELEQINTAGFFSGFIDLDRVGMYGYSIGGNTSGIISSMSDLPVNLRAAANLDGIQLIDNDEQLPVPKVPFLMVYGTRIYMGNTVMDLSGANDWIFAIARDEIWRVVFSGARHSDFSDLMPVNLSLLQSNRREVEQALKYLLLRWFNRHLKAEIIRLEEMEKIYAHWKIRFKLVL